jgi:hypothetical protein
MSRVPSTIAFLALAVAGCGSARLGPAESAAIVGPDAEVAFTYHVPEGVRGRLIPHGTRGAGPARNGEWQPIYSRVIFSERLEVFLVTGFIHACDDLPDEVGAQGLDDDPAAFLQQLRDVVHAPIGDPQRTTLGGLPALTVDVQPRGGACNRAALLLPGAFLGVRDPDFRSPGRLTVVRVGGATIGVLISAADRTDLAAWLPTAQAYVDSIEFREVNQ